jgi:O-antigen ligase
MKISQNRSVFSINSIALYLICIIMLIIPVYHRYLPPFMICLTLVSIIYFFQNYSNFDNISNKVKLLFFLFLLFFIWQLFGLAYSDYLKEGLRNIELRISMVLFPLIFITPAISIKNNIRLLLKIFALGAISFCLYALLYASYRSLIISNGTLLFNPHPLESPWLNYYYANELAIFQHPSYLSVYLLFSVFITLESFFSNMISVRKRILWFTGCLILIISIYLLSSRAEILTSLLTIPLYIFVKLKNGRGIKVLSFLSLIGVVLLISVFLTNPRVSRNLKTLSEKDLVELSKNEGRFKIWNTVSEIMKNNLIFGVGTGDIQNQLNKGYINAGMPLVAKGNYNSHNQFLEILLENGLIGLIFFLSIFGVMFYIAFSEKNILYMVFIIIMLVSFMFEVMLNRLGGVSFFALFSFLLIYNKNDNENFSVSV